MLFRSSHKSLGFDQMPAELIKVGGRTMGLEIHKLITSVWKKEKLPEEWKESIVIPIFIQHPAVKFNSICKGNYWGSSMWLLTQKVDY